MKRIAWITPFYFVETDIYIIPLLLQEFHIDWYIFVTNNEKLQYQARIDSLQKEINISVNIEYIQGRQRSLSTLTGLYKLLKRIKSTRPDITYTAMSGYPYFTPLVYLLLGNKNTVIAAHNVTTPKGAKNYYLAQLYAHFTLSTFKNFQTFSANQHKTLNEKYPHKNVFHAPFILKDYGTATNKPGDLITFLSFGYIRDYKRIDVLIQAAEKTYEELKRPFIVKIAGKCDDWHKYQSLIKTPELFDLRIESIPNEDIPKLFESCHYFATPYQDIAQSGSLIVGINYEKPIIASRLESFCEYIQEGRNGFIMQPASVEDLSRIMKYIITNHDHIYPALCLEMKNLKKEFDEKHTAEKYTRFFQQLAP